MVRILVGERGLEASSLALLGTSTIGKSDGRLLTDARPFPPMVQHFHLPTLAPSPDGRGARRAGAEPRDPVR
ncbi:hypothetical protein B1964_16860 [Gordonia sp. i37]|nr:hypothetical protein B1964_16860 [Gordonia sp. i37]